MGQWSDALNRLRASGDERGRTPLGNPKISNREASGLILFARAATAFARDHGLPGASFDWQTFGAQIGDGSEASQLLDFPAAEQLWTTLQAMADAFDAGAIQLDLSRIGSPAGTDATVRKLRADVAAGVNTAAKTPDNVPPSRPTDDVEAAKKKPKDDGGGGLALALFGIGLWLFDD